MVLRRRAASRQRATHNTTKRSIVYHKNGHTQQPRLTLSSQLLLSGVPFSQTASQQKKQVSSRSRHARCTSTQHTRTHPTHVLQLMNTHTPTATDCARAALLHSPCAAAPHATTKTCCTCCCCCCCWRRLVAGDTTSCCHTESVVNAMLHTHPCYHSRTATPGLLPPLLSSQQQHTAPPQRTAKKLLRRTKTLLMLLMLTGWLPPSA